MYHVDLKKLSEAESYYQQAASVLSVVCPFSYSYGVCLNDQGSFYNEREQYDLAEDKLIQSYSILTGAFQESLGFSLCVYNLAMTYAATNRDQEALETIDVAVPLLKEHRPGLVSNCEETRKKIESKQK